MMDWIEKQDQQHSLNPDWAAQFASVEEESLPAPISAPSQAQQEQQQQPKLLSTETEPDSVTVDSLSATAALLIDSVQHEGNPKFQNSEFMGLMKRLRDRKVVIEGNDMVDSDTHTPYANSSEWADEFSSSMSSTNSPSTMDKGKGRAVDDVYAGGAAAHMGPSSLEQTLPFRFNGSEMFSTVLSNAPASSEVGVLVNSPCLWH